VTVNKIGDIAFAFWHWFKLFCWFIIQLGLYLFAILVFWNILFFNQVSSGERFFQFGIAFIFFMLFPQLVGNEFNPQKLLGEKYGKAHAILVRFINIIVIVFIQFYLPILLIVLNFTPEHIAYNSWGQSSIWGKIFLTLVFLAFTTMITVACKIKLKDEYKILKYELQK